MSKIKVSEQPIKKFKRLFWDIETSYNVVSTWNIGYDLNINHDNILKERAIICICYKWAGESKVHSLKWNSGDDKQLIKDFLKILDKADESIGHNSDKFDLKWLRTRALFHNLPMFPDYTTVDTLKLARSGFKFNSNRLDYLGKFFGVGGKMDTGGFKLWQKIIIDNDPKALDKMISYCKRDVIILEKVYNRLNKYTKAKTHVGVILGKSKCSCPNCGSEKLHASGKRVTATGLIYQKLQCQDCHKYFQVSKSVWENKDK